MALAGIARFAPSCIEAGKSVKISEIAPILRAELAETAYKASIAS